MGIKCSSSLASLYGTLAEALVLTYYTDPYLIYGIQKANPPPIGLVRLPACTSMHQPAAEAPGHAVGRRG